MERLTDTSIEDVRNNLDAFDITDWEEDIYNKLAEYENFMEENGFESLEDIEQLIKNMEYYEGRYKWQCKNSRINYEEFLNLQQENEQLKQQLAEKNKLLENAIVPKFKIGDEIYVIFNEKEIKNFTIRIIESISDKSGIKFIYTTNTWKENGGTCSLSSDYNKFYKTKQGAKMAFKRLNRE